MAFEKTCPRCGAIMSSTSVGWTCPVCWTFVSVNGGVRLHEERPSARPKTNADRIRAMSDEQLADLIAGFMSKQRSMILEQLRLKGVLSDVCVVDAPLMAKAAYLEWLREPAEDVK